MILNDTGFVKEVYQQTGVFGLSGDFTLSNILSIFEFGVSGELGKTSIKFSGTKFFDSENRMIGSYVAGEPIRAALVCSPSHYSFYFNNNPVIFGQVRDHQGEVQFFFANSIGETDFTYVAKGGSPNFSITPILTFVNDPNSLTGYLVNNSANVIAVYSGELLNDDYFDVTFPTGYITGGNSGAIIFTPNQTGLGGAYPVPYNLYTNFGIVKTGTLISGYQEISNGYSMQIFGRPEINLSTSENYFVKIKSFSGDLSGRVYLEHVSGSGRYTNLTNYSGYDTGFASGFISESGFIYFQKLISGTGQGGIYTSESGLFTGNAAIFQWATGSLTGTIQIPATGFATGQNYTGLATGYLNYNVSGTILNGSGKLLVSGNLTGSPVSSLNLEPAFYTEATGAIYYNTPENAVTSDILYINTIYHGIVYGFHHHNINELAAYLNANTGLHRVRAGVSGANTILLTGFGGDLGNSTLLLVDQDNDGDLAISGPYLVGGINSGYNISTVAVTAFTGYAETYLVKSGNYQQPYSGLLSGSGLITTENREFSGIWNLYTGLSAAQTIDFRDNNYYSNGKYQNNQAYNGNLYAVVNYENMSSNTGITDIARLYVSGINNGTGTYFYIDITGVI